MAKEFQSFAEFYPHYLAEHSDPACRRLHFVGNCLVVALLVLFVVKRSWLALALVPVCGYGCAWIGHFFFERNRPATFRYPLYSMMGDWVMMKDILIGKVKI